MVLVRPLVSVIKASFKENGEPRIKGKKKMIKIPDVFKTPLRDDVVKFVFHQLAKNKRQAFGVSRKAGVQCSAESWGTGRAIARIPRVRGSGTHRTGQGAYGNMCRGGHMFSPRVVWRRWHRKVNLRQRRYAMAVAVAATGLPSLVMARGHRVGNVPEFPLVFSYSNSSLRSLSKTKNALSLLKKLGADRDLSRCKESKKIRPGKGKMRNRRYVMRKGPLLVHTFSSDHPFVRCFRNIPGVELINVKRLNLLKLAPGAKLGRFVIWTEPAFLFLSKIFHNYSSTKSLKHGEVRPQLTLSMPDIGKIINSDAVQKVLRSPKPKPRRARKRINPLKNAHKMHELNPYARELRRKAILHQRKMKLVRTKDKAIRLAKLKEYRSRKLARKKARMAKSAEEAKPPVKVEKKCHKKNLKSKGKGRVKTENSKKNKNQEKDSQVKKLKLTKRQIKRKREIARNLKKKIAKKSVGKKPIVQKSKKNIWKKIKRVVKASKTNSS